MDYRDDSEQTGGGLLDKAKEAFSNLTGGGDSDDDLAVENRPATGERYLGPNEGGSGSSSDTGLGSQSDMGLGSDTGMGIGGTGMDRTTVNDYASDMGGGNVSGDPAMGYNANAGVRSPYDRETDRPGSFSDPASGDDGSNDPLT